MEKWFKIINEGNENLLFSHTILEYIQSVNV